MIKERLRRWCGEDLRRKQRISASHAAEAEDMGGGSGDGGGAGGGGGLGGGLRGGDGELRRDK